MAVVTTAQALLVAPRLFRWLHGDAAPGTGSFVLRGMLSLGLYTCLCAVYVVHAGEREKVLSRRRHRWSVLFLVLAAGLLATMVTVE